MLFWKKPLARTRAEDALRQRLSEDAAERAQLLAEVFSLRGEIARLHRELQISNRALHKKSIRCRSMYARLHAERVERCAQAPAGGLTT